MKKLLSLSTMFFTLIAVLISCEKDTEDPNECNIIFIEDRITENTTFTEGNVYIIDINGDWIINNGATLTIEPGVVVKSLRAYQKWSVSDGAKVIANGTQEKPIIFTSQYDNDHGCDNTGDGTAPKAKDWGQFSFYEVSGSVLNYCHFYYGGGLLLSTVEIELSSVNVTNCVFAYNQGGDHSGYKGVLNLNKANADCFISNNVFYGNDVPISTNADLSFDDSNIFHNPDDETETNTMNGIFTDSYTIDGEVVWMETEVAFVIANESTFRIEDLASLTLGPDVVIKVVEGSEIDLGSDPGKIINQNGPGVFYTSIFDDSLKGDTNGDGSQTGPASGDWDGIIINHSPRTFAAWTNILYAK